MKQCTTVKYYVKIGKPAAEIYNSSKKVCGDKCQSCTHVFKRFKMFKESGEKVGDDGCCSIIIPQLQRQTLI